jgi:hypothetical protein
MEAAIVQCLLLNARGATQLCRQLCTHTVQPASTALVALCTNLYRTVPSGLSNATPMKQQSNTPNSKTHMPCSNTNLPTWECPETSTHAFMTRLRRLLQQPNKQRHHEAAQRSYSICVPSQAELLACYA